MPFERRQFARALRQQMTRAEEILWAELRGSRLHGAEFRRQVPIDRYAADLYCHAAKLAVELDGRQHEWFADYDSGRTKVVLESMGIGMLRVANAEVCDDLDGVLARIRAELLLPLDRRVRSPHPYPSPTGGGYANLRLSAPPGDEPRAALVARVNP